MASGAVMKIDVHKYYDYMSLLRKREERSELYAKLTVL